MIHTKSFISFFTDSNGIICDIFSTAICRDLIDPKSLGFILKSDLNSDRVRHYLSKINQDIPKILKIFFPCEGMDLAAYLCGIKIEGLYFLTLAFNNKFLIPVFYRELDRFKRKRLYEYRDSIISENRSYSDYIETDLKVYEELKTAIEDLKKSRQQLIEKNVELVDLMEVQNHTVAALRRAEGIYKSLKENIDEAILLVNEDGDIIDYNSGYLSMFEVSKETVEKSKIWDLKFRLVEDYGNHDKRTDIKESFLNYCKSGFDIFRDKPIEVMLRLMSGRIKCIKEEIFKFKPAGKVIVAFRFKDITKIKKMEQEMEILHQYESTKNMLRGIAHNFNTRFQCIIGNISMAMNCIDPGDKSHALLKNAMDTFPKINEFSKQIAVLAEEGDYVLTPQNIMGIIKEINQENCEQKYNIQIRTCELPIILCNLYQLKVAFMNIIQNSKDSMPSGGEIEISFDIEKTSSPDIPIAAVNSEYLCVAIKDCGIGIPEENLNRIFEPFFTTNISQKKGIGLTIAFTIINKHHGFINLKSVVGMGTEFRVFLPVFNSKNA